MPVTVVILTKLPGHLPVKTRLVPALGEAGARAVWVVDPRTRTVAVHEPGSAPLVFGETGTLRGGDVLPGFALAVREVFA